MLKKSVKKNSHTHVHTYTTKYEAYWSLKQKAVSVPSICPVERAHVLWNAQGMPGAGACVWNDNPITHMKMAWNNEICMELYSFISILIHVISGQLSCP